MTQATRPKEFVNVLVIDSTCIATQSLSRALSRDPHVRVHTHEGGPALEAGKAADVVLISANLEGDPIRGCEFARQMLSVCPTTRVVILVEEASCKVVLEAFRAGARGVFRRNDSLKLLNKCIWRVHRGQVWASSAEMNYVLEALNGPVPVRLVDAKGTVLLSNREQDVVRWVTEGLPNREIADRLKLSEHTVKNYLFRIFDKLGVSSRAELIIYTLRQLKGAAGQQPRSLLQDDATRLLWCREAVEQCSVAPYSLAELYRDGRGVANDRVSALMWFMVAEAVSTDIQARSKAAQQSLKLVMHSEQVNEAQRRAADWVGKTMKHTCK